MEAPGGRIISIFNRPMPDGRWVSCHEDITERRSAEERLREQKLQLDAALDNMTQGLCMFDAEGRIVLFNPRYAEIVGLPARIPAGPAVPRTAQAPQGQRRFLRRSRAVQRRGAAPRSAKARRITRIVAACATAAPTASWCSRCRPAAGSPRIEDITEQRRAEELLSEQKLQLDTALNNMSQGLNMFDAAGRLVVCNERYLQMYRLSPTT